jgi:hypothetical protein
MPTTIVAQKLTLIEHDKEAVRKVFLTQGYLKLKEMIQARCIESQCEAMNALLYPENDTATARAEAAHKRAVSLNQFLDTLDDLEQKEDQWFTVKLEHK